MNRALLWFRVLNGYFCYMLPYFVYVLHSEKDEQLYTGYTIYTGYTNNLQRRQQEHMDGISKCFRSVQNLACPEPSFALVQKLILYEAYLNKNDAIRREKHFKTTKGKRVLKIMLRSTFEDLS